MMVYFAVAALAAMLGVSLLLLKRSLDRRDSLLESRLEAMELGQKRLAGAVRQELTGLRRDLARSSEGLRKITLERFAASLRATEKLERLHRQSADTLEEANRRIRIIEGRSSGTGEEESGRLGRQLGEDETAPRTVGYRLVEERTDTGALSEGRDRGFGHHRSGLREMIREITSRMREEAEDLDREEPMPLAFESPPGKEPLETESSRLGRTSSALFQRGGRLICVALVLFILSLLLMVGALYSD